MSKYNTATKNANIKIELVERDDYNDKSIWKVVTTSPISIDGVRFLPTGAELEYTDTYEATEDQAYSRILSRGLLDACNISDGDFEQMVVEE